MMTVDYVGITIYALLDEEGNLFIEDILGEYTNSFIQEQLGEQGFKKFFETPPYFETIPALFRSPTLVITFDVDTGNKKERVKIKLYKGKILEKFWIDKVSKALNEAMDKYEKLALENIERFRGHDTTLCFERRIGGKK